MTPTPAEAGMEDAKASLQTILHDAIEAATGMTFHSPIAPEIIAALHAAGFKTMAREPTEAMKLAGTIIAPTWDYEANATKFRAMWDAAP